MALAGVIGAVARGAVAEDSGSLGEELGGIDAGLEMSHVVPFLAGVDVCGSIGEGPGCWRSEGHVWRRS
jgi:hypothetical protein